MFEKICIILLANLLFYLKTLGYKYVSDDIPSLHRPKHPNKWMQRFLVLEGHAKSTPVNDHAITMILHALVCVGIYVGFGGSNISFLASILFAFNPINNQGAVWISGRGYALSALGMVWALALPVLSPVFLFIATYSNSGFFAPISLIGSPYPWMLVFVPFIWAFHFRRFKKNVYERMSTEMFAEDKKIHIKKLIVVVKTFGFYLSHSIIPIKTTFYHSVLESMAGSRKDRAYSFCRFFWIGLLSIGGMAYWLLSRPWDMTCFSLLWWCVCIAPYLNFTRMSQETAERYVYVPNCGLMYFLASFIMNLK